MSPQTRGTVIALIGITAWAFTGIFMSYLLENYAITPTTLTFWRALFMGVAVWVALVFVQPSALRLRRSDFSFFIVYGFVGLAIFNTLITYSVDFNGASVATVLAYSSPAFTVLLAALVLKEALTWRKGVAVLLSLVGCALVVNAYLPETWQVNPLGILIGLASGLAFAVYNLLGRWSAGRFSSAWTVTGYGFLFAAAAMALTQTPATAFSMGAAWDGWLILLVLALGPSLVGFGLYTLSLRYLPASVVSLIATLEPVITALAAIPLLGESMSGVQWLGALLIIGAAALVQWEPRKT
ncbi:MAG: EamA family transporter [Anaerolineales bacterium]|nr:EamA family transporter [Anaerolineales bacterium]